MGEAHRDLPGLWARHHAPNPGCPALDLDRTRLDAPGRCLTTHKGWDRYTARAVHLRATAGSSEEARKHEAVRKQGSKEVSK